MFLCKGKLHSIILIAVAFLLSAIRTFALSYTAVATNSHSVSSNIIYLPMVTNMVPEEDIPEGRWPHTDGNLLSITYKWEGDLTNPYHAWRYSFQHGIDDWSWAGTKIYFVFDSSSNNTIGMKYNPYTDMLGECSIYTANGITTQVEAYGNLYWDLYYGYTNNQRRAVAAHEIGHMQSIGHIPRYYTLNTLMLRSVDVGSELGKIYTPQQVDISLVNQIYR